MSTYVGNAQVQSSQMSVIRGTSQGFFEVSFFQGTFFGEKLLRIALEREAYGFLLLDMRSVVGDCLFPFSFFSREMVQERGGSGSCRPLYFAWSALNCDPLCSRRGCARVAWRNAVLRRPPDPRR